ncbi:MAG: adenylosuccinate lyase [Alphaproteobacteria bacterium]|nr:adenylosuccinate lyase [Alphaproteobacteria bacterium]
MIPRYSRKAMADIWSADNRYKIWFEIEVLALEAMAKRGTIPAHVPAAVRAKGQWNIDRIDEIEKETRHDVLAFLTNLAESLGEESRFVHQGMTSSDVLDTTLSVQLVQATDVLLADVDDVLAALIPLVEKHLDVVSIGRSHGIHAEPVSFGLKFAGHYAAFKRCRERLMAARAEVATAAISGPVGSFATVHPEIEHYVAEKLGLVPEPISTQIIPRDRHAAYFAALAVVASCIENIAVEIRHLQRSEVREAAEPFGSGQKGSSAMPHKRNPVLSENLCGLARVVRMAVVPALENVALWHERDISHSAAERVIGPDATIALDFALARLAGMLKGLDIYPARINANLEALGGLHFSQRVMLALTQAGMSREDAYKKVQTIALSVWDARQKGDDSADFVARIRADAEIAQHLAPTQLDECFDLKTYLTHARQVWARVK